MCVCVCVVKARISLQIFIINIIYVVKYIYIYIYIYIWGTLSCDILTLLPTAPSKNSGISPSRFWECWWLTALCLAPLWDFPQLERDSLLKVLPPS